MKEEVESWSLRPATPQDVAALEKIENEVQKTPWSKPNLEGEVENPASHFLLATDDETDSVILGYIVFRILGDHTHLINIAVAMPFRGLGIARKMIQKMVDESLKMDVVRIVLEVRKSNEAALQLYQQCKFNITRLNKNFYSDGEDAYVLELLLQGSSEGF